MLIGEYKTTDIMLDQAGIIHTLAALASTKHLMGDDDLYWTVSETLRAHWEKLDKILNSKKKA